MGEGGSGRNVGGRTVKTAAPDALARAQSDNGETEGKTEVDEMSGRRAVKTAAPGALAEEPERPREDGRDVDVHAHAGVEVDVETPRLKELTEPKVAAAARGASSSAHACRTRDSSSSCMNWASEIGSSIHG